jgi:two-component system, chemotaxis family, CheB/CheR fusion protein
MSAGDGAAPVDLLLEYLKHERGFDFTGYKRGTLERRIEKRRQSSGAKNVEEYLELLQREPAEYELLFNTILINVTDFFRDDVPWEFLASDVVPRLLERSAQGIRVWSAGCATGQEAYSLAMLLVEAMGSDAFRERAKIYATDVDEEALAEARAGTYSEKEVEHVAPERLERYFERVDGRFVFRKDLRRAVIFGRNDLVHDPPISRVDLLVCRNTLMYFDAETQAKILGKFHFALRDQGYLFLGRAETLITHMRTFTPVDLKRRVFMKAVRPTLDDRLLAA